MNISEVSLKRPVLATVMSIALVLFGVIGFNFLGIREYPAIDPPLVTVFTSYAGANADIIESQITEPLEKSINGIPGIRTRLPPAHRSSLDGKPLDLSPQRICHDR